MANILTDSIFFGMFFSIFAFWIGFQIQKKWKNPFLNPMLISVVLIISTLLVTRIPFSTYQNGAKYLSYFLTPVTVCLAVPLYKQIQVLKDNLVAVLVSSGIGCIAHGIIVIGIMTAFHMDHALLYSLLPKSITTAIALGVSAELGGISGITVIGVMIAGIGGAVVGPFVIKLCHIEEPVAQGLAFGSASHAIGTSKAIEYGEIQAAMSSLAIVVTGLMTVVIVPIIASFL